MMVVALLAAFEVVGGMEAMSGAEAAVEASE